jgi:CRP-like cAMP-binding protein
LCLSLARITVERATSQYQQEWDGGLVKIDHSSDPIYPHYGVMKVTKISQETLAEMVGTTRSRVSFFVNRFRKLGFIDYAGGVEGGLQVHSSLLNVVLHD